MGAADLTGERRGRRGDADLLRRHGVLDCEGQRLEIEAEAQAEEDHDDHRLPQLGVVVDEVEDEERHHEQRDADDREDPVAAGATDDLARDDRSRHDAQRHGEEQQSGLGG